MASDSTLPGDAGATGAEFAWASSVEGSWDVASNWNDVTAGQNPASVAPGPNDAVLVAAAGGGAVTIISGTGASSSLTLQGATLLDGQFATGTFSIATTPNVWDGAGSLTLDAGDTLTVTGDGSIAQHGQLTINSGGALTVDGNFNGGYNQLSLSGGSLTAGSLTTSETFFNLSGGAALTVLGNVNDSYYYSSFTVNDSTFTVLGTLLSSNDGISATNGGTVQLAALSEDKSGISLSTDASSSIEVGSTGGAAAGTITVDAGVSTTGSGSLTAPSIVNNGTITVTDGQSLSLNGVYAGEIYQNGQWLETYTGGLTGSGLVEIGNGSTLSLNGLASSTSTNEIEFAATGGVLSLGASDLNAGVLAPAIAGFNASDAIDWQGTVTSAVYANDQLTLLDGTAIVGVVNLAGGFAPDAFAATELSSSTTQINLKNAASPAPDVSFSGISFTGSGASGDVISSTSPVTFSGTVSGQQPIANVEVYDGVTDVGAASVSNGAWSLTTTLALGVHDSFSAIATDQFGNTAEASKQQQIDVAPTQIDTVPPMVTITSAGELTNQATQTVTGTVMAGGAAIGGTVTLFDNSTQIGTAQVDANGSWSASVTLSEGSNSLTAADTDAAGNTGTSAAVSYTLESVAPVLTVANSSLSVTEDGTVALGIAETPFDPRDNVSVTITGVPADATLSAGTNNGNGSWTLTPAQLNGLTLTAGEATNGTLTVTATNTEGATASVSQNVSLTVNAVAPALTVGGSNNSALIAAYSFDGTAADISGNGNNLALYGDATLAAGGLFGEALSLDGTQGSFARAQSSSPALDLTSGDFTVQIWAKFNDITNGREETLIEKFSGSSGPGWTLTLQGGNNIQFYSSPAVVLNSGGEAIPNNVWQQFVIERSGDTYNLYWDSNLVASGTSATPLSVSPNQLLIGARDAQDGRNFTVDGLIDNVEVLDTALTPAQIAQSWNNGAGVPAGSPLTVNEDGTVALPITVTPFDPRDTVSITITGVPADATLSAGINNGNGSWTLTPAQLNGLTLTAGEATTATLTVTATNTGGATASVSDTISLMVNPLTPPTVSITSPGGLTNQATQTISGTVSTTEAAAGSTVTILDNGTQIATATAGADGAWSTSVTLTGDGSHSLTAKDTDAAGNTGTSAAVAYTLDTVPPTVTITSAGGLTNQATQTITGMVTAGEAAIGSTVTLFDNGTQIGTAVVDSNGSWSANVTLSSGANSLLATDTDAAGNSGTSNAVAYIVSTQAAPTIADAVVTTGSDGNAYLNAASFGNGSTVLTGTSAAGDTVTVSDGTNTYDATVDASGNWNATVTGLLDGQTYTYIATATDGSGNAMPSQPLTFTVDTSTSESAISDAAVTSGSDGKLYIDGANFTNGATSLTGTAAAGDTVTVSDGTNTYTATVDTSGNWTAIVTGLVDGTAYTYTATATDPAGNTAASPAFTFTVDIATSVSAIDDAAVTTGTDGKSYINAANFNGGTTTLTGSATPGDTLTVSDGTNSYNATTDTSGNWSATVAGLAGGQTYTYTATATDAAGNTATSQPFSFTVKTITSESAIADAAVTTGTDGNPYINAAAFNGGTTTLTGIAEAGDTVVVSDGANSYNTMVDASGNWTATLSGLTDGTSYSYTATATDAAGNTATSQPFGFTVDTSTSESAIADAAVTFGTDGNPYINATNFNSGTTTLTGSATPGDTVAVSDGTNSYNATVDASGNWTAAIEGLVSGQSYSYTATATDAAGNTATSQPFGFSVKAATSESAIADAAVTIGTDGNPYINAAAFNGGTTTLTGTAEAGDTVVVSDGTSSYNATVDASGNWTAAIEGLVSGQSYSYTATATDAAGNTATSQPLVFTVKTATSESPIADAAVTFGTDGNPYISAANFAGGSTVLTGSAEPGDTVVLSDNTGNTYQAAVEANGNWTVAIAGLISGQSYSYTATATDAASNTATSQPFSFAVKAATSESAIADAAVTIGTDGNPYINAAAFNGGTTTLTGNAEAGDTVVVSDGTNSYNATVDASGNWTAAIGGLVSGQSYGYTATATDAARNTATSQPFSFTVNTTIPTVATTTANPASGDYNTGATVKITVTFTETVTVAGTPALLLNDGGTASYLSGSGTKSLVFAYTVANGQNTSALAVAGSNLDGGTITDAAGNPANLSAADVTFAGLEIGAAVLSVSANYPSTAIVGPGLTVTFTVKLSGAVTVGGSPVLTLNDGGQAVYAGGSGTSTLTFSYKVGATGSGQNTPGLAITGFNLNGGAVYALGNSADPVSLAGAAVFTSGPQVDTTAPVIASAVDTPSAGDLKAGKTVTLTLSFSTAVNVTGAPTLSLNDGGVATYKSGSGTGALSFSYTVAAGQNTASLAATALNLNGGSIADKVGNAASFALSGLTQSGPQIDTTAPAITNIAETPSSGDLDAGKTVSFALSTSEPVTVSGTPELALNDGGTALYNAGASTATTLVFTYTIAAGQNVAALAATSLSLNGGSILDGAGNAANLSLTGLAQSGPQVDTTAPTVKSVTANPATADLGAGKVVLLTVTFSEAVTVSGGTPVLTLNDGATASYQSGSGSTALTFAYTVRPGDNTPDLTVTGLSLGGASIQDGAGNNAVLSGAVTNPAGILQIDTTTPALTAIAQSPATGDLNAGKTVTFTLKWSENVTVSGGTPTLSLNDGGTASYTGGSGSSTLTFKYTVTAGQNTAALAATGLSLNGASIADGAGNAASLGLSGLTQTGPQIDTVTPVPIAITETPSTGDLKAGKTVTITVSLSEAVTVSGGTPTLTLNDGGVATYSATASSPTSLVFNYTVSAGQNTSSLSATKLNLNGATIADGAGNAANLALTGLAQTGPQIDTTAPTVTGATAAASSKDLNAGKTVEITLSMSEPVTVSGAPTLTLNDGGTATYDAALSSASALTFDYTVLAGQNTTALTVTGVTLANGASIQDLAGNAAVLTGADVSLGLQIDTLTPAVSSVIASPAKGSVTTGSTVAITLKMNEAVTVAGTPVLLLNDGGTATYNPAGSTATTLVFDYVVPSNQGTAALSVIGLELGSSGAIEDGAGNVASLSGAAANLGLKVNSITTGPAALTISGTSEAEIFGASSQNVAFASGADGTLKLDSALSYTGSVSGLTANDTLDLSNLTYGPNMTVGYSGTATGGVLSIGNGSQAAHIALLGNYLASSFTLSGDGHGGTNVVDPPMLASTPLISTPKSLPA